MPLAIVRTWKNFAATERLSNFKAEFEKLSNKLNQAAIVHIAVQNEQVIEGGASKIVLPI